MTTLFRDDELLITPHGPDSDFTRQDGTLVGRALFLAPPWSTGVRDDLHELWLKTRSEEIGVLPRIDHVVEDVGGTPVLSLVRWPGTHNAFHLDVMTPDGAMVGSAVARTRFGRTTIVVRDAAGSTLATLRQRRGVQALDAALRRRRGIQALDARGDECADIEPGPPLGRHASQDDASPQVPTIRARRVRFAPGLPAPSRALMVAGLISLQD